MRALLSRFIDPFLHSPSSNRVKVCHCLGIVSILIHATDGLIYNSSPRGGHNVRCTDSAFATGCTRSDTAERRTPFLCLARKPQTPISARRLCLVVENNRRSIERIIETDPVIKKGLRRGIINTRALARYIQESDGINSSFDAILGTIRRYPLEGRESLPSLGVFKDCSLALRSKIGDLILELDSDAMKRIVEFAGSLRTLRGENLRILVGLKSMRVIAEQKAIAQLKEALSDHKIIKYTTNLVEISVLLSQEAEKSNGVIARITTEIALHDICIWGSVCVLPEFIVLVEEKDASRAHEALQTLIHEASTVDRLTPRSVHAVP